MNFHYRLGLRGFKTALAVLACLLIAHFLKPDSAFMSTTAAIICLQSSYTKTLHVGIQRLLGTLLGGFCGFVILNLLRYIGTENDTLYLVIIPICLLGVIYLCNVIERQDALVICSIVFLSIVLNFDGNIVNTVSYVSNRMLDTSLGVISAMCIDKFFMPIKD